MVGECFGSWRVLVGVELNGIVGCRETSFVWLAVLGVLWRGKFMEGSDVFTLMDP